jgi:hypothetical protein
MQEYFVTQCRIVAPSLSLLAFFPWSHFSSFFFDVSAALVDFVVVAIAPAAASTTQRWLSLFFAVFHVIFICFHFVYFDPNFELM